VTPEQRVEFSKRVITGWEAQGIPGGRLEDSMGILWEEVSYLRKIARDHPDLAERAGVVIERYERMASKLRQGSN
jgi:hypothetical protein